MSKGAVGLTAGYWPENVYRYLATPGISLDEGLVTRASKRRGDEPALIGYDAVLTYKQLAVEMELIMKALLSYTEGKSARLGIAVRDPLQLVKLIFGALRARWSLFITKPSVSASERAAQISRFNAEFLITDDPDLKSAMASPGTAKIIEFQDLQGKGTGVSGPKGRQDLQAPAIALVMDNGSFVYHSHKSLLAGAVSWSSFLPLTAEDRMLAIEPLGTWEGLYSLLPVLFRGGSCLMADLSEPDRLAEAVRSHRPIYTILPRLEARKLYGSECRSVVQAFRESLRGLFVSVNGPFTAIGRRRLRNLLQKPALLTYGSAEAGPVLSSHPTWYLDAAVGIPLTNVDVWPLNPADGNPLEVPWETIEYAEIGVKSPMTAIGYETQEEQEKHVKGGWLRSWIVATMDPNGLFYLMSRVED